MWESSIWRPQGNISLRRMFAFATALIVACFVYIIASAPLVHAADAEFSGDTLTYNSQQFSGPFTADGTNPDNLEQGVKYFIAPSADDPTKATIIYFSDGDPQAASNARITQATIDGSGAIVGSVASNSQVITVGQAEASDTNSSSCRVDGVGWIVCSMSKWIAEGVDYLYGILTKFLLFTPLSASGSTSSIYQLWNAVRNFANIAFVIAFLIIIYSEMAGGMLGSYTVKKLLPRIIVAAILVNISFWLCAVFVDLSNILGVSIQDLFSQMRASIGAADTVDLPTWGDITAALLAGSGITLAGGALLLASGGTIGGLAFLLLGALIPAILAALVAVAILAARQALITILVILAPLAFVAYLLPNTEEWFNRWRKFFMTLLLMFPIFSLIFGGSQIAGNIIIQNARDISVALLGLTVQVVPLFITPFLIKLSSGMLGTIAGIANDRSKGLFDRGKNWADSNRKLHQQRGLSKRPAQSRAGRVRPTDLAQRINNRRLHREKMTAAHQAKSEAQFDETIRGRAAHHRSKDANLRKHAAEATSNEAWDTAVYGANGLAHTNRAALHHQAHMAEGRAKLIEDRATAHAERDLQTSINTTAALRNLKIETDVDSAHAKFQAANVEAEGKITFDNEVLAGRALWQMAIQTHEFTKRSETAQADIQSRADEHWSHIANTDAGIRQQRLTTYEATQSTKRAEEQWNTIISNIEAVGGAAPGVNAAESHIANSIQRVTEQLDIQAYAKANAETQKNINLAKTLSDNTHQIDGQHVLDYAGGIRGQEGKLSVQATAKKAASKHLLDDVQNIQDTMDYNLATNVDQLETEFSTATTMAQRVAYAKAVAKNGGPGIRKLKELFVQYENTPGLSSDDLTDFKELVATEGSIMSAGKDIEFWLTKSKDDDGVERSFTDIHEDVSTWTNLSANAFAGQNATTHFQALTLLHDQEPTKYMDVINSIRNNPGALAQVKLEVRRKFSIYSDSEIQNAKDSGTPLPNPGTVIS